MLLALFAQVVTPVVPPPDFVDLGSKAIFAITPVVTVLVIWGFKVLWSKLPASIILFAAPVVSIGVNWLISYVTGVHSANVLVQALLGATAVWLHEIATTLESKGIAGAFTVTKGLF